MSDSSLPAPRRVFLSHTSDLSELPKDRSFVAAAAAAVSRAGDAVSDMVYFPAGTAPLSQACRDAVHACDVYVLICGFRYGTPVRDVPSVSHTEFEHEAAGDAGLPRLVFLLGNDTHGPPMMFIDLEHGSRQAAFRARLLDTDRITATVTTPDQLETSVLHALTKLPRAHSRDNPVGRIWGIPARSVEFAGRTELLTNLHTALQTGGRAVVQAIHGIGGVGKSTTAIEYAHRYGDDYDITWWIPAEDPTLIPNRLADLARALSLASNTDSVEAALARLLGALRGRDRWLLIFDNAETPTDLTPFLPGGDGHVIITSRNPDWHGTATGLDVNEFTRTESITVLQNRLAAISEEDANRLADALGDLPQAVDQAGALLADTGLTVNAYLSLLIDRTAEVLTHEQSDTHGVSTTASWQVAFDRLAHDPAALQLLTLIAWLAPEPVPLTLVTNNPDRLPRPLAVVAADPLALAAATATLRRRGMARVTPNSIELHRIPAALLRTHTNQEQPSDDSDWAMTAVHLLRDAVPDNPWNNPSVWPMWRQLLPHVLTATDSGRALDEVTAEVSWLLRKAGNYLQSRGEPRTARPLIESAYHLNRQRLDESDPDMLSTAADLALVLDTLKEHQQAWQLNNETLARSRETLGDDHPDTLSTANNLANNLLALNLHEQARQLHEDTLIRRRWVLGDDHPDTLSTANNLAADLRELGDHERARQLDEVTYARSREILGEDHPDTLRSARNLAIDLRELGDNQRAWHLHQDTLHRFQRVLGEDHPDTLDMHRWWPQDPTWSEPWHVIPSKIDQEQVSQRQDALARIQRAYGKDHPLTLGMAKLLGDYKQRRQ